MATKTATTKDQASERRDWQRDEAFEALAIDAVDPAQWDAYVKMLVRRVWLENDGESVTVEGAISEQQRPSDRFSPRS